jgi:glycosyltransferase involved in cell wall biosynthesis
MTALHLVGPLGLADPSRPSGGNVYDVRLAVALRALGRDVEVHEAAASSLRAHLDDLPDDSTVLVDGLVGSAAPGAVESQAHRLRIVALVHLPLGLPVAGSTPDPDAEARSLAAASAVVCTSEWTRAWLASAYRLDDARLHVVRPGVDKATLAEPSSAGSRLLSVGAITPVKGHDVLVTALRTLDDRRWTWTLVGASVDAAHATALWATLCDAGLDHRVTLAGALAGPALSAAYAAADLVVLPSRHETYGMVATEALARGVPVLASDVGGVGEALSADRHDLPGILVPPEDAPALSAALRDWLDLPELRSRLRTLAAERRATLPGWEETAAGMARVLDALAG